MKINAQEFSNKDITIAYDPCICKQSEVCCKELSSVFRNSVIPWIDVDGANIMDIKKQIKKCPSGALKFRINKREVA